VPGGGGEEGGRRRGISAGRWGSRAGHKLRTACEHEGLQHAEPPPAPAPVTATPGASRASAPAPRCAPFGRASGLARAAHGASSSAWPSSASERSGPPVLAPSLPGPAAGSESGSRSTRAAGLAPGRLGGEVEEGGNGGGGREGGGGLVAATPLDLDDDGGGGSAAAFTAW
jgi:hypothetical protein